MQKYAYNINNSTYGKMIQVNSLKNYHLVPKGFYDDIENSDISIKQKEKELSQIKNDSIKEFVFTNKKIPGKWKKKLTYQNDVINTLIKDSTFLNYVGRVDQNDIKKEDLTKMNTTNGFKTINKLKKLKASHSQIFPKINNQKILNEKNNLNNKLNNKNKTKTIIIEEEENLSKNDNNSIIDNKKKSNKIGNISDEEIENILEELKITYPIKLNKEETSEETLENEKKEIKEKKVKKEKKDKKVQKEQKEQKEQNLENNKNNLLFAKTYNISASLLKTSKGYNPFDNDYKLKIKKQREIRQNIFNNVIPPENKANSKSMLNIRSNMIKLRKLKLNKKEEKFGPFLFLNNEKFYKKTKIDNPLVEKQLKNIHFSGPYYSYCPPCLNKNLEYYNHLKPKQCLKLIHYIKKMKGKKYIKGDDKESISIEKKISSFDDNLNENVTNIIKK